jgi:uncharacterized membrane protein YdbT with pleckstrin-like domain
MPVIACPDCGRDVSTLAPACPNCGRPSPAGTAPIAGPVPTAAEQTLWSGSPSKVLLAGHIAGIVLVAVGIPAFAWFFAIPYGIAAAAVIVAFQLLALAVSWIRLHSTQYTVTNQRVMIERGVFSKSLDEIDLRYVDDSLFHQSFFARILGIGDVTLISSDKTNPRYVLRSIGDPRGVREMIRSAAYQSSQRQIFTRST